jgi:c-di-GMP-related signal transduction protein
MNFFIGRQAILDRKGKTVAYELLYREHSQKNAANNQIDGNIATSRVIANAFVNLGVENIAKSGRVFINFTKDLIVDRIYETLPKDKIVVEVLEDVMAEKDVLESLSDAKKQGYTIALDDFVFLDHLEKLVALADIIKVDFIELNRDEIRQQVEMYKPFKLKLLAEKVENNEEFQFALDLGFEYFQGFFFQRPTIEVKSDIAPYQSTLLRALSLINDQKSSVDELVSLISGDVYLHTKLLKFINSPFFGLKSKVASIDKAVQLLGLLRLKEWLNIMIVSKLAEDKPEELVILSTIRAKFASLIAMYFGIDENSAYLLGMFSLMDSVMNLPMELIIENFDYLDEDIKKALLNPNSPPFT